MMVCFRSRWPTFRLPGNRLRTFGQCDCNLGYNLFKDTYIYTHRYSNVDIKPQPSIAAMRTYIRYLGIFYVRTLIIPYKLYTADNHNYRSRWLYNIILLFRKSEWNRNHNNIEKHVYPSIYLYILRGTLKYLHYTYIRVPIICITHIYNI